MTHYLIAGGAGFIGSHLTDALLSKGHTVTVLDNFATSTPENLNSAVRQAQPRLTVYEHNITTPLPDDVYASPPDVIIHLASIASPDLYQARPIETLRCGSVGTRRLLSAAEAFDSTFLFASTSEVYGDPEVHPQPESYVGHVDPYGPRACYDESKRYAEALIRSYTEEYNVDTRIMRIFNTYGPRMRDGRAIPTFIRQAINGDPITVYGDGTQTRSFCYIDDLIRGITALLESSITSPVNLGNPEEITIYEAAELIQTLADTSSKITYTNRPTDDPDRRKPDITKARRELDWEPAVSLREGLEQTINARQTVAIDTYA